MKVVFRVNLGLLDAKAMKLNAAECKAGMLANVDDAIAQKLLQRGVVVREADAAKDELLISLREEEKRRAEEAEAEVKGVAKKPELKGVAS